MAALLWRVCLRGDVPLLRACHFQGPGIKRALLEPPTRAPDQCRIPSLRSLGLGGSCACRVLGRVEKEAFGSQANFGNHALMLEAARFRKPPNFLGGRILEMSPAPQPIDSIDQSRGQAGRACRQLVCQGARSFCGARLLCGGGVLPPT